LVKDITKQEYNCSVETWKTYSISTDEFCSRNTPRIQPRRHHH